MTGRSPYPARPPFFAVKFVRLMVKTCLANELGAEAFALLTAVVLTEDAKRYRGPVTFYNGQLLPLVGVASDQSLERVRSKAVAAGWLVYERGGKGVPGRYWVTVPAGIGDLPDTPVDENPTDYHAPTSPPVSPSGIEGQPGQKTDPPQNLRDKRGEIEVQTGGTWGSFLPIPSPSPEERVPPAADSRTSRKSKKPTTAETPRPRNALFDAVVELCGVSPVLNSSHIGKVVAALASAENDPPYTADDVRQFGARFHDLCPWAKSMTPPMSRPTPGTIQKHIEQLRKAKPPLARSAAVYDRVDPTPQVQEKIPLLIVPIRPVTVPPVRDPSPLTNTEGHTNDDAENRP